MSLHVRHPDRIRRITEEAAENLRRSLLENPEEYAAVRADDDPPTLLGYVEIHAPAVIENYGKQLLPKLITHAATTSAILRMKWGVFGAGDGSADVLTADRPLYFSHGIADEQCVIALPLSPQSIFLASRSESRLDSILANGRSNVVRLVNESIVSQAEISVYGAHHQYLRFVEHFLRHR